MKKIMLFTVALIIMIVPIAFGQYADMNSDWRYGNLVFYDASNRESIIDAIGPNVTKYIDHFIEFDGDTMQVNYYLTKWLITPVDVSGAGNSKILHLDSTGGMIKLNADTLENDGVQIQLDGESFRIDTSSSTSSIYNVVYYGARVLMQSGTQMDAIAGLCTTL